MGLTSTPQLVPTLSVRSTRPGGWDAPGLPPANLTKAAGLCERHDMAHGAYDLKDSSIARTAIGGRSIGATACLHVSAVHAAQVEAMRRWRHVVRPAMPAGL